MAKYAVHNELKLISTHVWELYENKLYENKRFRIMIRCQ